jgi:hypothetical protein
MQLKDLFRWWLSGLLLGGYVFFPIATPLSSVAAELGPVPVATRNPFTAKLEYALDKVKIIVESPRPLSDAADLFEHKYGWKINYEDPAFLDTNDLVDITALVSRVPSPARRSIISRGGTLEVQAPLVQGKPDAAQVLSSLIETHNGRGNPGLFRLHRRGDVFYIIATGVKTPTGQLRNIQPALDTNIALPISNGTLLEVVSAVFKELQLSNAKVGLGLFPYNFFNQTQIQLAPEKLTGPAREILQNILDASGRKLAWRTGCASDNEQCTLHIHFVMIKRFDPLLGEEVPRIVQ